MSSLRDFYDADLRNKWYGAHTGTFTQFFARMASAYQYFQNATDDARNGVYMRGLLAGLSGRQIVALWEADE